MRTPQRAVRACLLAGLAALALRVAIVARPLVVVDRWFVPDDAYYTLSIARSIARGLGPSVDGVHLTSGFQPLLAFLLVPVFWVTSDPDVALRAALGVGAIADSVTACLLGWLALRIGRRAGDTSGAAGIVAAAAWALSPAAIATSLNGLETSLAIACVLGALCAWSVARETGRPRAWLVTGALLGLCLFARVDTVFFVAAAGLATVLRGGPRAAAACAAGGIVTIGPWWAYSLARFGTVVPESGAAVREQALAYQALGMNVRDQLAWAAGAVTGPPWLDSSVLREALGSGASAIGCAVGVALAAVLFAVAWARRSGPFARAPEEVRLLAMYAGCIFLFYALYLPATWFFRRYLAPVHVLAALAGALAFGRAWRTSPRRRRVVVGVVSTFAVVAVVRFSELVTSRPEMTVDQGHHGAKGYREPARQILGLAPPGAVIGSLQSGALGWFSDGSSKRVVNLDGVVDREAGRALREGDLAGFARSRGVTHFADWEVNKKLLLERAGDPRLGSASLRKVGEAEPQGRDERFVLYAVEWPSD